MLFVIHLASLYVIALFLLHINGSVMCIYGYMSNVCGSSKKNISIVISLFQSVSSAILWRSWLAYTQPERQHLKRTGLLLAEKSSAMSWPTVLASLSAFA